MENTMEVEVTMEEVAEFLGEVMPTIDEKTCLSDPAEKLGP